MIDIIRTQLESCKTYVTKDGSEITEIIHPELHNNKAQSLAQARVRPGQITQAHYHQQTEEIYFLLGGQGRMRLDNQQFDLRSGEAIVIKPGQIHQIENTGTVDLLFLCCCSPAYSHDDTILIDSDR